jgi:hypothetical protein
MDPPQVNVLRWNDALIRYTTTGQSSTQKVSDILFNIQEQLNLFGTVSGTAYRLNIEFLLEEVHVYSINTNDTLEVIVFDPTNADNGTLATLLDRGTAANPSKIGYLFPSRVSTNPAYGTTESGRTVMTIATASTGGTGIYLRIKWRAY